MAEEKPFTGWQYFIGLRYERGMPVFVKTQLYPVWRLMEALAVLAAGLENVSVNGGDGQFEGAILAVTDDKADRCNFVRVEHGAVDRPSEDCWKRTPPT